MTKQEAEALKQDTDKFAGWILSVATINDIIDAPGIWDALEEYYNNEWCDHCDSLID